MSDQKNNESPSEVDDLNDPFSFQRDGDPFVDDPSVEGSDPFASGDDSMELEDPFAFDSTGIDGNDSGSVFASSTPAANVDSPFENDFEIPEDPSQTFEPEAVRVEREQPREEDVFGDVGHDPDAHRFAETGIDVGEVDVLGRASESAVVAESAKTAKGSSNRITIIGLGVTLAVGAGLFAMNFLSGPAGDDGMPVQQSSLDTGLEALRPASGDAWQAGATSPALPPMSQDRPMQPLSSDEAALDLPTLPPANAGLQPVVSPLDVVAPSLEVEDDVAALPASTPSFESEETAERFESMSREIAELRTRLASLEERPSAPTPAVQPPAKPEVVENWSLRGVFGDTAWLAEVVDGKPGDAREVTIGDSLDGVGRVKDITKYEGNWIVVTDAGVILRD